MKQTVLAGTLPLGSPVAIVVEGKKYLGIYDKKRSSGKFAKGYAVRVNKKLEFTVSPNTDVIPASGWQEFRIALRQSIGRL